MYITTNGNRYDGIRRLEFAAAGSIAYTGESIPAGLDAPGLISVYRDDGFLLRQDDAADFMRTVSQAGALVLANSPLPEPVTEPDETLSADEVAEAIAEGVNSI